MRKKLRGFIVLLVLVLINVSLTSGLKLSASTEGSYGSSSTHVAYGATVEDYANEHIQLNPGEATLSNDFSGTGNLPDASSVVQDNRLPSKVTQDTYGTATVSRSVVGKPGYTTWSYNWGTSTSNGAYAWLTMNVQNAYNIKGDATATNQEGDSAESQVSVSSPGPTASLKNYYAFATPTKTNAYAYQSFDLAQPSSDSNAGNGWVQAVNYAQKKVGPEYYAARTDWTASDSQLPIKNSDNQKFPSSYKLAKITDYMGDAFADNGFVWSATYKGTINNMDHLTYYGIHTHDNGNTISTDVFNNIQFTDTTNPHGHSIYKQPDWMHGDYIYLTDMISYTQAAFDAKGNGQASIIAQSPSYWLEAPTENYFANSLGDDLAVDYSNGKRGVGAWQLTEPSGLTSGSWFWGGLTKDKNGWISPTGSGEHNWIAFGHEYANQKGIWHLGQDFDGMVGDPVYAIADGKVVNSDPSVGSYGTKGTRGGALIAQFTNPGGSSFYALYGHLNNPLPTGTTIKAGDILGYINDYYSTDGTPLNHLHFGINPSGDYNPYTGYALDKDPWRGDTSDPKNHYGWVDPILYLGLP